MKKILLFWIVLSTCFFYSQQAEIPVIERKSIPLNYYADAYGTGYDLKTRLKEIIKQGHVPIGYKGLWNLYKSMSAFGDQWYENDGTVLDIYSEIPNGADPYNYRFGVDQCGNYTKEGDCYNREHLIPQSVFYKKNPMLSDAFHIWPTDGKVNAMRSDYPFGRVGNSKWVSKNGSQLGNNANSGYSKGYNGVVFEPIDEFKGDIARAFFYFATRYEDEISSWSFDMFNRTKNQVFTDTFRNILLTWHVMDPVSDREIAMNEAIYSKQKNRNPYIDHPEWVEMVWGNNLKVESFEYQPRDFLEIYPTLSSGTVYIKSNDYKSAIKKVMVFSLNGILLQTIVNSCNSDLLTITIQKSGSYIIKVMGNDFEVNRKVIIQ